MITTPEIICDVFSFLDKDRIERIQLVNQFWNSVIIRHKNILPLRQFDYMEFTSYQIYFYATGEEFYQKKVYRINFDGTNLSKSEENMSSRYSQLTVDEVLKNLNDLVFYHIEMTYSDSEDYMGNLLNLMKLGTTKTGGRFRGRAGTCIGGRFGSKLNEIYDNYILIDNLSIDFSIHDNAYVREVCANPEIVQLPSTPKKIRLGLLQFNENDEVLNFTCNGKLNGANRLTIELKTSDTNYANFIRQWFKIYRTHQNPISLVGKFEITYCYLEESGYDAVKTFLNDTQLRVKYSLETKEFHSSFYGPFNQYVKRSCVLHETDSYALVIEMAYAGVTEMSSINVSDLDQPPYNKMKIISFCLKSL